MIRYTTSKGEAKATISGVEFNGDMKKVFGGPDGIRTMTFPKVVRKIQQGSFHNIESLRSVVLNEGLEALGTDEYKPDGMRYFGVFEESRLERVRFP